MHEGFVQTGDCCIQIDRKFDVALADAKRDVLVRTHRIGRHSPHTTDVRLIERKYRRILRRMKQSAKRIWGKCPFFQE